MIDWTVLGEAVGALKEAGLVGVLVIVLVLFFRGQLWPKNMVDKTIEAQHKSAMIVATEVKEGMEQAVTKGISAGLADGYMKIAKINNEEKS